MVGIFMHTWRFFQSIHSVHVCMFPKLLMLIIQHNFRALLMKLEFDWAFNSMFKCINFEWNETKEKYVFKPSKRKSFVIQVHFSNRNHEFPINSLATNWRIAFPLFYCILVGSIQFMLSNVCVFLRMQIQLEIKTYYDFLSEANYSFKFGYEKK